MSRLTSLAIILIAICSFLTRAEAQNAYRCGNSYSQTPCPGGVPVDADDSRSKAQKAQSESAIKRDVRTADSMEKTRLQQEEAQRRRAAQKSTDKTADKTASTQGKQAAPGKATHSARKKARESEYFTAAAPGDKKKKKSETAAPAGTPSGNTSTAR